MHISNKSKISFSLAAGITFIVVGIVYFMLAEALKNFLIPIISVGICILALGRRRKEATIQKLKSIS